MLKDARWADTKELVKAVLRVGLRVVLTAVQTVDSSVERLVGPSAYL